MSLYVTLSFPDGKGTDPLPGLVVHRYQVRDAMSELFDLVLSVASTDPALDFHATVGKTIVVRFTDEKIQPEIKGLVRGVRQLSSGAASGAPESATYYEIHVVPPLWLSTRRRDHRIFEDKTVVAIVEEVLSKYDGRIPAPVTHLAGTPRTREYVVQYGETDFDFVSRILADEAITWFFDHGSESALTLVDDTTTQTRDPDQDTRFIPRTDLITPPLHVFNVTLDEHIETSATEIRDYDYEKANNPLIARKGSPRGAQGEPFERETDLEAYAFEVGKFTTQPDGDTRATRLLDAHRATARTFTMEANFNQGVGTRIKLVDHPRTECNGTFLIVRVRLIEDDGAAPAGDPVTNLHLFECVGRDVPFLPRVRPRQRIHSTHTGVVVGGETGDIVSDKFGRVRVELRWDRDSKASRWMRVSQAWAGNLYGFFALPRVGDEVVIGYLDGDPDEPLVVGRVHNSARQTTVDPTGKDRTVSTWKSQSLKKPSGYNEVLMDDATNEERLELHAEKDYRRTVEHDSFLLVKHDEWLTVEHNKTDVIKRAYSMSAGSITLSTGPYTLLAKTIKAHAKDWVLVKGDSLVNVISDAGIVIDAPETVIQGSSTVAVRGGSVIVTGAPILLESGGSSIKIEDGGITIKSSGPINVNGSVINLNC
jgi:type VI secretion system secreted protein VgrG